MAATLGTLNPLTYRGYVYDHETGLYYLQSRYYNPEWGRFLNADVFVSTGQCILGNNMFAYCRNNPVFRKDITGTTDVALLEDGTNLLDEEKSFDGGKMSNCGSNSGTNVGGGFSGNTGKHGGQTMSDTQGSRTVTAGKSFLPDDFYSKHAPKQSTPNSSRTQYTYNNHTGEYERSTVYYDFAGRQIIRIDWTDHGYSDHGNPHVHITTYNSLYRDGITERWDLR